MFLLVLIALVVGSILLVRNEKFLDGLALVAEALIGTYQDLRKAKQEEWEREHPPRLFLIEQTFRAQTLAGFDVQYWMNLACERIDVQESIKEQVDDPIVEEVMAHEFRDQVFEPYFNSRSYFWHLDYRFVSAPGELYNVFPTIIGEVAEEDGRQVVRQVLRQRLKAEIIMMPPFRTRGCEIKLVDFASPALSAELIERNYQVLSDEQKEAILETAEFGAAAELLAVSLLKQRLDVLRGGSQKYSADLFTIDTEKTGRSLKIKWKFKADATGHSLLGFRNTGGFSNDQWSEDNNGARVIDAYTDGEVVEILQEGTAYFYTFFLKPFQATDRVGRKSPLRFQVTVETKDETEAIEAMLEKVEKVRKAEWPRENMSQALKELGSYVEMDTAFDAMEKSFIDQIGKGNYSEDDKQRKIERLQDIVRQIRSKYEP